MCVCVISVSQDGFLRFFTYHLRVSMYSKLIYSRVLRNNRFSVMADSKTVIKTVTKPNTEPKKITKKVTKPTKTVSKVVTKPMIKTQSTPDCDICCEKTTHVRNPIVRCFLCNQFECCLSCFKKYWESIGNFSCMSCKQHFTARQLLERMPGMTLVYLKEASRKFETSNVEQEIAQLPATQPLVDTQLHRERLAEKTYYTKLEFSKQLMALEFSRHELCEVCTNEFFTRLEHVVSPTVSFGHLLCFKCSHPTKKLKKLPLKERKEILQAIRDLKHEKKEILDFLRAQAGEAQVDETYEKAKKKFKCQTQNCRGFVDNKWYCSICDQTTCSKCLNTKTNGHKCLESDLETAKYLRSQTKPCPNCGERISKISGCDQMFCTECKTPFSWNKGTISKGPIHNPHYFEMMQQNLIPQEAPRYGNQDLPCGGQVYLQGYEMYVWDVYRCVQHIQNVTLHQHLDAPIDRKLEQLRISYLLNNLDKSSWEKQIRSLYARKKFNYDVRCLCDTFIHTGMELLRRLPRLGGLKQGQIWNITPAQKKQFEFLHDYWNSEVEVYRKIYGFSNRLKLYASWRFYITD